MLKSKTDELPMPTHVHVPVHVPNIGDRSSVKLFRMYLSFISKELDKLKGEKLNKCYIHVLYMYMYLVGMCCTFFTRFCR